MSRIRTYRPSRRALLLTALAAAVVALAWLGAPAAFHVFPLSVTREDVRLADALRLEAGSDVADIGAGSGRLARAMAKRVAPGRVYATEIDASRLKELRAIEASNIEVVQALSAATGLADDCCDAAYLRNVYHHLSDPGAFNLDLRRTLRPGGRLAIIDFSPKDMPHLGDAPPGAAPARTGHGVATEDVMKELQAAGFAIERIERNWGGWMFLIVARAPS